MSKPEKTPGPPPPADQRAAAVEAIGTQLVDWTRPNLYPDMKP